MVGAVLDREAANRQQGAFKYVGSAKLPPTAKRPSEDVDYRHATTARQGCCSKQPHGRQMDRPSTAIGS